MKNLLYIIPMLILFSCQKTIEFDGELKESKIVVNSIVNTEDTFRVHLSKSLSLIDNGNLKFLKNANVKLFNSNNELLSTPQFDVNGYYIDPTFKFKSNETYRIEVEHEGFKSVSATDALPSSVKVNKVDTQDVVNADGMNQKQVTIDFSDAAGADNYYMVEVKTEFYYKFDSFEFSGWESAYLNTVDPNIEGNNGTGIYENNRLIFTDQNFDGKDYKLRFNFDSYVFENNYRKVNLRFYSLSESVYNYYTSVDRYENVQGNPFATPVQVFSNIEGGFGIFGGASIYSYKLKE